MHKLLLCVLTVFVSVGAVDVPNSVPCAGSIAGSNCYSRGCFSELDVKTSQSAEEGSDFDYCKSHSRTFAGLCKYNKTGRRESEPTEAKVHEDSVESESALAHHFQGFLRTSEDNAKQHLREFGRNQRIAKQFPRRSTQSATLPQSHKSVVVYYQTQYQNNNYISPSPLTGIATHLLIATFHLNRNKTIHLNNVPPSDSSLKQMWTDAAHMQASGIKIMGMLGGAVQGAYHELAADFDEYYKLLSSCITDYKLDGIDLDVEEHESLDNIGKLIKRLRADFGGDFIITMAPVASALKGGPDTFSGFNYADLEAKYGNDINWYNVQFYSGYGSMENTTDYDAIVKQFPLSPSRLVAGTLTNEANGDGFVELDKVESTVTQLVDEYGDSFGGVAGWEYFNSMPQPDKPWKWGEAMRTAMSR